MAYNKGEIVAAKVTSIVDFGAFVELSDRSSGLVHITEIPARKFHVNEVLNVNDEIEVMILGEKGIDRFGNKKYELSKKKVDEQKIREQVAEDIVNLEGEEKSIREIWKIFTQINKCLLQYMKQPILLDVNTAKLYVSDGKLVVKVNTESKFELFQKSFKQKFNTELVPLTKDSWNFYANIDTLSPMLLKTFEEECECLYMNFFPQPFIEGRIWNYQKNKREEIEAQLEDCFPNIVIISNKMGELSFRQSYDSHSQARDFHSALGDILNEIKNGCTVEDEETGETKEYAPIPFEFEINPLSSLDKFLIERNVFGQQEHESVVIGTLRGEVFSCNGVEIGKLKNVNYPVLTFVVEQSNITAVDRLISEKKLTKIATDLTGDSEKVNRLQESFDYITENFEQLRNPMLASYLFDASKATPIDKDKIKERVKLIEENKLNSHLNEWQVEAIAKAVEAKDFYIKDGGLECGFIDEDYESEGTTFSRYHGIDIEGLLSPENHVVWIDTNSPEIAEGTSRTNKGEVDAIEWVLSQLAESESFARYNSKFNNEEDKEIGLITFYGAQLKQLRRLQANYSGKLTLKPSSVDRFQGMERNIVIVSLVRSNCIAENEKQAPDFRVYKELGYRKQKDFGFAKSPNRLNVALSRAKRLLIIVGNSAHYSAYKNKDGEAIYKNVFDSIKNNPNGRVIRWEHKLMKKRPRPISKNRSANLNTRDINPATDGHLRVIETWLRPCADRNNPKIAVLELSTKAVKCLIGKDQDVIRSAKVDEFNFQNFIRNANKTETGKGLNSQNEMDMRYFEMNVLPTIRNWKRVMQAENVDIVYTVATAAYRTARNRDEIVSFIKDKTGINVRILSKKEESVSTMFAYLFSSRYKQEMLTSEHVIMIDQGGGSTEVSVFRQNDLVNSYSINLGTTALRNILFLDSDRNTPVEEALSRSDQKIKERLVTFYKNMGEAMTSETESFCISVGTAITHATGGKNNAAQHDRVMTREKIEDCINTCTEAILSQFDTVGDLNDFDFEASKGNKKLDDQITMRLGLPMFLSLMDKFNIKEIHVSGTGLWYGIYLQYLHNISDK